MSRNAAWHALQHIKQSSRVVFGITATQGFRFRTRKAGVFGPTSKVLILPFSSAATVVRPAVVISSSPSEPWTTQILSEPRFFSTWAIGSTQCFEKVPIICRLTRRGIGKRAQQIEDSAGAEFDPRGADIFHRRVMRRREHEADAGIADA